jgi:asparagine synthase (glutamine-hydrolysing)
MKGRLPAAALARYDRGLQGADWYLSMQEALPSLRHEVALQKQSPAAARMLDIPKMESLLQEWPESGYETAEVVVAWHATLTRAISMGYFLRTHDPAAPAAAQAASQSAPANHE